jgi:prevent-host-death family protein
LIFGLLFHPHAASAFYGAFNQVDLDVIFLTGTVRSFRLVLNQFGSWKGEIMETIGAYEAKTHLPRLLERVARGERITITKHGVPIAVLQPPASQRKAAPKKVIAALREFREKNRLQGLSIRDMIIEGRR